MKPSYIRKRAKRLKEEILKARGHVVNLENSLKELRGKCSHPNAKTVNVPGDYYSKTYSYQYCSDCGENEDGY